MRSRLTSLTALCSICVELGLCRSCKWVVNGSSGNSCGNRRHYSDCLRCQWPVFVTWNITFAWLVWWCFIDALMWLDICLWIDWLAFFKKRSKQWVEIISESTLRLLAKHLSRCCFCLCEHGIPWLITRGWGWAHPYTNPHLTLSGSPYDGPGAKVA